MFKKFVERILNLRAFLRTLKAAYVNFKKDIEG